MRRGPRIQRWAGALLATLWLACGGETETALDPAPSVPTTGAAPDSAANDAEGPLGRWIALRPDRLDPKLTPEQREQIAQLEAIGYAEGSRAAPELTGVTVHDRTRTQPGLNFYTSGHAPEALLVDSGGNVIHRWHYDFLDIWPDFPRAWLNVGGSGFWRRAHLFENGDVLAIFEGLGIIKLDRDSNLLWSNPEPVHHDLEVLDSGDIAVLTRRGRLVPRIDPDVPILEDYITILDPHGSEKRRISLLEAFERSEVEDWLPRNLGVMGDFFHTNSLEVLDGHAADRHPAFRRGNVLISVLRSNLIAVVDLEQEKVVWSARGTFVKQHDPKLLNNGNLLLFDNLGVPRTSRVLEFDPSEPDLLTWEYRGSEADPFRSPTCGTAQRLANGNTLITESDSGRAFEVTPESEIVWEFFNPHRAGDADELIATVFELIRLPENFPVDWAEASPTASPNTLH